ncbi:MAG: copper transporter [Bacillota bacterium]
MIDLRYLTISLVGIFLALAVGIVLGGVILGDDALLATHERLMIDAERERQTLLAEMTRLRSRQRELEGEIGARGILVEQLLAGRLKGQTVSIVALAERTPEDLTGLLYRAGAAVISDTFIRDDAAVAASTGDWRLRLDPSALASALVGGEDSSWLNHLAATGYLERSGSYQRPDAVVLWVGQSGWSEVITSLVSGWRLLGVPVVAVAPEGLTAELEVTHAWQARAGSTGSYLRLWSELILAIDDADSEGGEAP